MTYPNARAAQNAQNEPPVYETVLKAAEFLSREPNALSPDDHKQFVELIVNHMAECPTDTRQEIGELFSRERVEKIPSKLVLSLLSSNDPLLFGPLIQHSPHLHATHILELLLSGDTDKRAMIAHREDLDYSTSAALIRLGGREPLESLLNNPAVHWSKPLIELLIDSETSLVDPLYRLISGKSHVELEVLNHAYWRGSKAVRLAVLERLNNKELAPKITLSPRKIDRPKTDFMESILTEMVEERDQAGIAKMLGRWLGISEHLAESIRHDLEGVSTIVCMRALDLSDETLLLVLGGIWSERADLDEKLSQALNYSRFLRRRIALTLIELWREYDKNETLLNKVIFQGTVEQSAETSKHRKQEEFEAFQEIDNLNGNGMIQYGV